ncbi:MAG: SUMF1/EgtB/PvdO family nonheme iron enzyme [Accumulibacter sp.]|uniref:formylglycine-generating enzyme family protein n=1 Tax=Accumulibacter sp. TaxID=2053492 RepID=UPI002FC3B3B1
MRGAQRPARTGSPSVCSPAATCQRSAEARYCRRRCKPAGRPDTTRRVVRGGSWNNNRDNARCAYRNDNDPGNRNNNLGLRLVCVSHIVQAF